MPNYIKLIVMGHLTNDPEIRETGSGVTVGNTGIAYNEKDRDPVFIDCVLFGQTAEFVKKHFRKGDAILMEGRLQTNRWTGSDGVERQKLQLKVEKVSFAGNAGAEATTGGERAGERGGVTTTTTGGVTTTGGITTDTPQEQYGAKPEPTGESEEIPF